MRGKRGDASAGIFHISCAIKSEASTIHTRRRADGRPTYRIQRNAGGDYLEILEEIALRYNVSAGGDDEKAQSDGVSIARWNPKGMRRSPGP